MKYAFILSALTVLLCVADLPASAQAPGEVKVKLGIEISDSDSWLAFRESVLAIPVDTARVATITVAAQTGGSKSIVLDSVKLESKASMKERATKILVIISGKMAGVPALRTLEAFEQAFFQMQAGAIANDVAMAYGMFGVIGRLTDIKVSAPQSSSDD